MKLRIVKRCDIRVYDQSLFGKLSMVHLGTINSLEEEDFGKEAFEACKAANIDGCWDDSSSVCCI